MTISFNPRFTKKIHLKQTNQETVFVFRGFENNTLDCEKYFSVNGEKFQCFANANRTLSCNVGRVFSHKGTFKCFVCDEEETTKQEFEIAVND